MRSGAPGKMTVLHVGTSVLTCSTVTAQLCGSAVISCTMPRACGINRVVLSVHQLSLVFTVKGGDGGDDDNNNKNSSLTVNTS